MPGYFPLGILLPLLYIPTKSHNVFNNKRAAVLTSRLFDSIKYINECVLKLFNIYTVFD